MTFRCGYSDLFHDNGGVAPITESDILRVRGSQSGVPKPAAHGLRAVHLQETRPMLEGLAALVIMHGSSFNGDDAKALIELDGVMEETLESTSDM